MILVERERELAALENVFAACRGGSGTILLISGAVGSGKTALMHAFAARALAGNAIFLSAAATHSGRALPLGVLGQLFRGARLPAANSARAAHLLDDGTLKAARYGSTATSGAAALPSARIFSGLSKVILDLAGQQPVVIGVDDMHHADSASLECLLYLVRRMRSSHVCIILSESSLPLRAHPLIHAELHRQPHFQNIQLAPLSRDGVARVLAGGLGQAAAASLAPACHAVSGGHPLLVNALAEDHRGHATAPPGEIAPGRAFQHAALTCLERSDPAALSVARGIAVLGEPTSTALLAELLAMDVNSTEQTIRVLDAAGLLDAGRFRHESARAAVLAAMTAGERAGLHWRVAQLLHQHGTDVLVLASHLTAAGRADVPWALPVLHEAAQQAIADDDAQLAIGHLRQAFRACSGERQRAAITASLARAEWRMDPAAAARHLPVLTAAAQRRDLADGDAIMAVFYLLWQDRARDAGQLIEELARVPLAAAAAADLAAIRLWAGCVYPGDLGRLRRGQAPDLQVPPGGLITHRGTAAGVLAGLLTRAPGADLADRARQILPGSPLDETSLLPITFVLTALICADESATAFSWCRRLMLEAETRRMPAWQGLFAAFGGMAGVRQGSLAAAADQAGAALRLITPQSWGVAIGLPLASLLAASTAMGKYEEAAACLRIPVPDSMFGTLYGLCYLQARGQYHLATGRHYAALADAKLCGQLMTSWRFDLPGIAPWRTDAAQVYLGIGMTGRAQELAAEQLGRLAPAQSRLRGISLRVLAAATDVAGRPPILRKAVETLQKCADRLELARAYAQLGQACHALGELAQATAAQQRAYQLAEQCGIEPLRRSLLSCGKFAAHGFPATRPALAGLAGELSEAERRVAILASRGYTNRQIAGELFITVSTVEQHLTRVYRKLKVKSRAELPLELHAQRSSASA